MFVGVRPFDWLMFFIETAVLALIGYEVVADWRRRRTEQRRLAMLNDRVLTISRWMDKGRRIQSTVPDPQISNMQIVNPWLAIVKDWTQAQMPIWSVTPRVLLRPSCLSPMRNKWTAQSTPGADSFISQGRFANRTRDWLCSWRIFDE